MRCADPARRRRGARRDLRQPPRAAAARGHRAAAAAAACGPRPPRRRRVRLSAAHARSDRARSSSTARSRGCSATSSRSGASGSPRAGCSRSRAACGPSATAASGAAIRGGCRSQRHDSDRARDRRLRAAARALPVPGGPVRARRAAALIALGLAARGLRRGRRRLAGAADGRPREGVQARLAGPGDASPRPGRSTLRFAVRTPDGKMLTQLPHGRGPAHGRAPDHRARRPLARSSTSIRRSRPSGRLSLPVDPAARRPLPRARRRLPGRATPARATSSSRTTCRSAAGDVKAPLPAYAPVVHTGGLTFRVAKLPALRLAEPASMIVDVTDAQGKPVTFTPFYGALAHAIFFRAGSLDYFHSHICGNDPACTAGFGTPATTGPQHEARPPRARRPAAGDRALAAVPPGHPPRASCSPRRLR